MASEIVNEVVTEKPAIGRPKKNAEHERFSVSIPKDLYDRLIGDHRYDMRMERQEYVTHIFQTYADQLDAAAEKR